MPPKKKRATAKGRTSQAAESTHHDNTIAEDNRPKSVLLKTKSKQAKRTIQYSNGLESTKAPFDEKSGQFVQTIELKSDKLFSTKPVLIEEGELKGRRVIVLEPEPTGNEVFPFFNLPPEIRVMIYEYLFEEPGSPLEIYGKGQPRLSSIFRTGPQDALPLNLLKVNRQIHAEATPFLYSSYKFEVSTTHMLSRFLSGIGPENTGFLTSVELGHLRGRQTVLALCLLSSALSLRSLTIGGGNSRIAAGLLRPVVQAMCDAGRDLEDALSIISWSGYVEYSCPVHNSGWGAPYDKDCSNRKKAILAKDISIRSELRQFLEHAKAEETRMTKMKQEMKEKRLARTITRAGRQIKAVDYADPDEDDDSD